jgi:hypothetical protein
VTAPTPEQQAAGQRCMQHTLEVELLTSRGDVDGAMDYLARVEHTEGPQMVQNITALMTLRLRIPPPEML